VNSDPADPTRRLIVTVPPGIPSGGPTNPGDADKTAVVVSVTVLGNSTAATVTITVRAPSGVALPTITGFVNAAGVAINQQLIGQPVTITGTNFSTVAARNIVTIPNAVNALGGPLTSIPVTGTPTATQLTITLPNFSDVGAQTGNFKTANVTVTVNDTAGNPIGSAISPSTLRIVRGS
jgi:hypothetical protein